MDFSEHMYSAIVISSSERFTTSVLPLLGNDRYYEVFTATDAASARRKLTDARFDIAVINAPLKDEFGTRLALDICDDSTTGVLLLVKSEHYNDIEAELSPHGVLVVSKPTSAQALAQSLTLMCGTRERLRRMEKKTASIEEKMEEIRIVNKAKWLLIEQLKMTESEAHRYIEKTAMDRCVTRRKIAENILATYK